MTWPRGLSNEKTQMRRLEVDLAGETVSSDLFSSLGGSRKPLPSLKLRVGPV